MEKLTDKEIIAILAIQGKLLLSSGIAALQGLNEAVKVIKLMKESCIISEDIQNEILRRMDTILAKTVQSKDLLNKVRDFIPKDYEARID